MAALNDILAGYPTWEMLRNTIPDPWVAVAIEFSVPDEGVVAAELITAWVDDLKGRPNDFFILPYEIERLKFHLDHPTTAAIRLMLFVRRAVLDKEFDQPPAGLVFVVLAVGAPFSMSPPSAIDPPRNPEECRVPAPHPDGQDDSNKPPIIAIIDDGIAFLNARFCKPGDKSRATRFKAVWLQAEVFPRNFIAMDGRSVSSTFSPTFGIELRSDQIDTLLASGRPDADIYRAANAVLYSPPSQQATNTSTAHGTHVLDLAAGEAPETGGCPLIAVQLAPGAAKDTSGRRLEPFLVMGLRWIIEQARNCDRDLVVNLSLGSLAGPGNATHFIADSIRYELDFYKTASKGKEMRIVVAYGNSYRSNLVAEANLMETNPAEIDWRIQPDDYSSSFLELRIQRSEGDETTNIGFTVTPPGSTAFGFAPGTITSPGSSADADGKIAAILPLHVERDAFVWLIAVAPTASLITGDQLPAPPGAWKIKLEAGKDGEKRLVTLRVQRNDTPVGYRVFGRQSYLADPGIGGWDEETRDYTQPKPGISAIRRDGTANAYAGLWDIVPSAVEPVTDDQHNVYYVGAVRPNPLQKKGFLPTLYTSSGLLPKDLDIQTLRIKSPGPTLVAMADDGRFLDGRPATSVYSGVRSLRLSGTSIAAGLITRRIAKGLKDGTETDLFKFGLAIKNPGRDLRTGFGVVGTGRNLQYEDEAGP